MRRMPWIAVPGLLLLFFFFIPLLSIFLNLDPHSVLVKFRHPLVYEALYLSLITSLVSVSITIVLGTPLAYILARYGFKGKNLVDSLVDLPMVLPPAVAGVALVIAFGRRGLVGQYLGFSLSFSTPAVVLAQTFVAAPFFVRAARSSFMAVNSNLEKASLTLGASPWETFCRVTLPLSLPGLLGGAVMSWARALGEFGATILFAGNLQGITRTLPLAIYTAMENDFQAAMVMSALMVIFSLLVLILVKTAFKDR